MLTFTPGPWHYYAAHYDHDEEEGLNDPGDRPKSLEGPCFEIGGATHVRVARVFPGDPRIDARGRARGWTAENNARLIAKCPAMYEYIVREAQRGDEEAAKLLKQIGVE